MGKSLRSKPFCDLFSCLHAPRHEGYNSCFHLLICLPPALNIEALFLAGTSRLHKAASLPRESCRLENGSAGFKVSWRPCLHQLGSDRSLPKKNRVHPSRTTFGIWKQSLPALVTAVLFLAGAGPLRAQVSGRYRVNTKESRIEIHLFKGGFLSSLGENHLISLTQFSGKADLSRTSPWKAQLTGKATSMKVIDPWGDPSERKEVQNTMLGPHQLDVKQYPLIKLHSVSFDPTNHDTTWNLKADVELHGVTQKVQFALECHQTGNRLEIRGKKMFKLTNFNIKPFSAGFGAVKVKNAFEVTYKIILDRIQ